MSAMSDIVDFLIIFGAVGGTLLPLVATLTMHLFGG